MANYSFSSVRKNFNFITFCILSLAILCSNSTAQTESKLSKSNFGTLAVVSEKNEMKDLARPRIVFESKAVQTEKVEEKTESADKTTVSQPDTILVTSAVVITQLERQAFDILNQKRIENGLQPVVWSEDMAKIARLHSENMAKFKFFSHTGHDGSMVNDRADLLGFSKWKAIGENIAYNRGFDKPAEFASKRWMLSPMHRENILNPRWKESGVGVAITADGTYYFTQVFILR